MKFQTLCMTLFGATALAAALPVDPTAGSNDLPAIPGLDKLGAALGGAAGQASEPEKRQDLKVDDEICRALKSTPYTVSIPNRNALQEACAKLDADKNAQPEKRQEQPPSVNKAVGDVKAAVGNAAGLGLPI